MKKRNTIFTLILAAGLLSGWRADAQFSGILQKAKDKAAQKADDMMNKNPSDQQTTNAKTSSKLTINSGFDFMAGDSVLFATDFANSANGTTTNIFKTNGAATVVSLKEETGKWLALQESSTYKLTKQIFYPKHFTVEYDVIAVADQIKDIYPMVTGFTKDNSVRDFNSGDGAYLDLMYYNDNQVQVNSSYNGKYLNNTFELGQYANRKMHISMAVDGDRMVIYLDKTKIADTQLFLPTSPKNFYISGPMQYHNASKLLVSNFRITTFKKD